MQRTTHFNRDEERFSLNATGYTGYGGTSTLGWDRAQRYRVLEKAIQSLGTDVERRATGVRVTRIDCTEYVPLYILRTIPMLFQ